MKIDKHIMKEYTQEQHTQEDRELVNLDITKAFYDKVEAQIELAHILEVEKDLHITF